MICTGESSCELSGTVVLPRWHCFHDHLRLTEHQTTLKATHILAREPNKESGVELVSRMRQLSTLRCGACTPTRSCSSLWPREPPSEGVKYRNGELTEMKE